MTFWEFCSRYPLVVLVIALALISLVDNVHKRAMK